MPNCSSTPVRAPASENPEKIDVEIRTHEFRAASRAALLDDDLRSAMERAKGGFVDTRRSAVESLENFEAFREYAKQVKNHVLQHLDSYLCRFESRVIESGGTVHWARNGAEANRIVLDICKRAKARKIIKGKSMVSEEAGTNQALEAAGYEVVETDLGEYIIQLAGETPSHIIAPAVHKSRQAVTDLFHRFHGKHGLPKVTEHQEIVSQARQVLRDHFCTADVGITGGNFLVADTGSVAIVTNEGNGDLAATLPAVHIVTTSIEKVIPDMEALGGLLRLLGRSATGQTMSVYTTLFNGPGRHDDPDGPREFHVVLVDNGRSGVLGGEFQDILRCIKCGACMNHCPVYTSIGGHAYGWVYPGPMGSVLTPLLVGRRNASDLPHACSLNGRCATVCPVKIPLPELLRDHRRALVETGHVGTMQKIAMGVWFQVARRRRLYRLLTRIAVRFLNMMAVCRPGSSRGSIRALPRVSAWTDTRDFPRPGQTTFQALWRQREGRQ